MRVKGGEGVSGVYARMLVVLVAEDTRPLCQLSSKRLEDNWHSGLLSSAVVSFVMRASRGDIE